MKTLFAFPQRRQAQPDDVEPVQQVGAETAVAHLLLEVLVGRGDHPHVDTDQLAAADAEELVLGQHPQQTGLQRQRHVANLVQKQGSAIGLLEATDVSLRRAGEGAGFVSEQFGLKQLGWNRRGV
jgi:hypothetical protein